MNSSYRKYAQTLFERAKEKDCLEEADVALHSFCRLLRDDQTVCDIFFSPCFEKKKKAAIIGKFLERSELFTDFVLIIIARRREKMIFDIERQFIEYLDKDQGVLRGTLAAPFPIDDKYRQQFKERLEKKYNCKVTLNELIDPRLLGGVKLIVGDTVYDGTFLRQLQGLQTVLKG